jgi:heterodisulfide reductase subunit A2
VLVVGGGIAGITAAMTLAKAGKKVYLVEREPSIGGHMAKFDKTFPTLDCAACILTPKMSEVGVTSEHHALELPEVTKVDGYVGNYTVQVKRKARYIDEDLCTGCQDCITQCVFKEPKFEDLFNEASANANPSISPSRRPPPKSC